MFWVVWLGFGCNYGFWVIYDFGEFFSGGGFVFFYVFWCCFSGFLVFNVVVVFVFLVELFFLLRFEVYFGDCFVWFIDCVGMV